MAKFKKSDYAMILAQLEELCVKLGIKLRYENLKDPNFYIEGGSCKIGEENHIIIHKKLENEDKIDILVNELRKFPLEDIFLTPLLRSVIFKGENDLLIEDQ